MTPEFIAIVALALYLLAGIFVLFLGGRLVQHDLDRDASKNNTAWPGSRAIEDVRPIQHLIVDFFAGAEPCDRLLAILARQQEPLGVTALLQEARPSAGQSDNGDAFVFGIERAALWIMRVAGLVSLNKRHVFLTDAGREVHRRIYSSSLQPQTGPDERLRPQSVYAALFVPEPTDTDTGSDLQRAREALRSEHGSSQRKRAPAPIHVGQLRHPNRAAVTEDSTELVNLERMHTPPMKKRTIIMTASDHEDLSYAIAAAGKLSHRERGEMTGLEAELARAKIVGADEIPADVITMNSRAELLDLETGERMEFTLVFPMDANIEAGKISVLAPLGTAMLGYRVGDEFEWTVPYGLRRLKVMAVRFQPEAALAMAA
jgi:regulator of nucleoside diphosphate kinase